MKKFVGVCIMAIVVLAGSQVFATNGMETPASGGRAAGMGGSDLAVAEDATAMNTNPAGMVQIDNRHFDVGVGLLMPQVHYENSMNDEDSADQYFPLPVIAYGARVPGKPVVWGVGLFAQGGMGVDFQLDHPLLGKDTDYYSNVMYAKLTPTVAWRVNDRFAVGLALNLGYSAMAMRMPYTVSPSLLEGQAMPGMTFGDLFSAPPSAGGLGYDELVAESELSDTGAWGYGAKLGMLYSPNDQWRIGLAYTFKSELNYRGKMHLDMTDQFNDAYGRMVAGQLAANPGWTQAQAEAAVMTMLTGMGINPALGMEGDYDAEIDFAWPQKLGLGVAWQPNDRLLLAMDITWIDWSDTMKDFKVTLKDGDNKNINTMVGDDEIKDDMPLDWEDQVVVAVGAQYVFNDTFTGRLGYNYGRDPIPDDTIFPVFPATIEHHATVGGTINLDPVAIHLAYEYAFPSEQDAEADHQVASEYDESTSTLGAQTVYVMVTYAQ